MSLKFTAAFGKPQLAKRSKYRRSLVLHRLSSQECLDNPGLKVEKKFMKVALLQTNSLVGGVAENLKEITDRIRSLGPSADLVVLPELALIGYPPKDLLSFPHYLKNEAAALRSLQELSAELNLGILASHTESSTESRKGLWGAATLFDKGQKIGSVRKSRLPYYDIFEEERFFSPYTKKQDNLVFRGKKLGVFICEDAWEDVLAFGKNDRKTHTSESSSLPRLKDADLIINLSASPFYSGKFEKRRELFSKIAKQLGKSLFYANSWGAQDDIVFDGRSFALNSKGEVLAQAAAFKNDQLIVDTDVATSPVNPRPMERWEEISQALVCGIRDYAQKSGFKKLILGMSGGIDSALVCWLASQAVGPENVSAVSLPTQFNSKETRTDARVVSENLGVSFREISIQDSIELFKKTLGLGDRGLSVENLQSRTRGLILMGLSNEERSLLVACGNKSELAMGYSTLYGDMCGSLLPIGDLYKTDVFGLCRWINNVSTKAPFPESLLTRPPSAELAPGQKDSDSLPDYSILDAYLEDFIENQGLNAIGWKDFPDAKTQGPDLYQRFTRQEFKRRQAAPILKIRLRSFGSGWSMPIAKSNGLPLIDVKDKS